MAALHVSEVFSSTEQAARAVERLAAHGVDERRISLLVSQPIKAASSDRLRTLAAGVATLSAFGPLARIRVAGPLLAALASAGLAREGCALTEALARAGFVPAQAQRIARRVQNGAIAIDIAARDEAEAEGLAALLRARGAGPRARPNEMDPA